MNTIPSRINVAERFINLLITHVRNGSVDDIMSVLEEGSLGKEPSPSSLAHHSWFRNLDHESHVNIRTIVQEAIDNALFSVLVILDGAAGGYPLKGQLSDYALYVQAYSNEKAYVSDEPHIAVRLNPANSTEDLHDIFRWMLEEVNGSSE